MELLDDGIFDRRVSSLWTIGFLNLLNEVYRRNLTEEVSPTTDSTLITYRLGVVVSQAFLSLWLLKVKKLVEQLQIFGLHLFSMLVGCDLIVRIRVIQELWSIGNCWSHHHLLSCLGSSNCLDHHTFTLILILDRHQKHGIWHKNWATLPIEINGYYFGLFKILRRSNWADRNVLFWRDWNFSFLHW